MTPNEKLIEEAAKAIFAEEQCDRHQKRNDDSITENWNSRLADADKDEYRSFARAALAVFEKAHAPTDDEREALRAEVEVVQRAAWAEIHGQDPTRTYSVSEVKRIVYSFDNVLSSALRRSEEPQGEPSDAQVMAAMDAFYGEHDAVIAHPFRENMRAALRAASAVTEQGHAVAEPTDWGVICAECAWCTEDPMTEADAREAAREHDAEHHSVTEQGENR